MRDFNCWNHFPPLPRHTNFVIWFPLVWNVAYLNFFHERKRSLKWKTNLQFEKCERGCSQGVKACLLLVLVCFSLNPFVSSDRYITNISGIVHWKCTSHAFVNKTRFSVFSKTAREVTTKKMVCTQICKYVSFLPSAQNYKSRFGTWPFSNWWKGKRMLVRTD